jgi:hypothetical protein
MNNMSLHIHHHNNQWYFLVPYQPTTIGTETLVNMPDMENLQTRSVIEVKKYLDSSSKLVLAKNGGLYHRHELYSMVAFSSKQDASFKEYLDTL